MTNLKVIFIAGAIILAALSTNIAFSDNNSPIVIPLQEKGAQTYYLKANLGGLGNNDFMVDTGSGYTTINLHTLSRLSRQGKATYVKELVGVLADGSERTLPVYRLSNIVLGESCKVNNIEAVVIPGSTRHILGLNTLKKMGSFEFSFQPPQLVFRQCEKV